jgi:high-affinity iron transporter
MSATLALAAAGARAAEADVATAWRLLDYIAVDYEGAVEHGKVINTVEYEEQVEFAGTVANTLATLPAKPARETLLAGVADLQKAIADRADADRVALLARRLGAELLAAYPVAVAPARVPDLARGGVLYAEQCASCHGASGDGAGPAAAALEVPPIDFTDHARARQRSLFALYQAITQGIDGTAMPGYAHLSSEDRWALAFHVGQFAFPADEAMRGEALWQQEPAPKAAVPDLKSLADTTPAALESRLGATTADAITAYLRRHPEALAPQGASGSLALARSRLAESLAAYRAGDSRKASSLALSAYLDGFEPLEPTLAARDGALLGQVERAMGELRASIQRGEDASAVQSRVDRVGELLDSAQALLASGPASQWSTFLGAATILLREGLEALLIVIAMLAFLRKAERTEVVRFVHGGWIGALVAGVFTWIAATWLIQISGASRELTEGFGSILAAAILLFVGIWMHGKSQADEWHRYIKEKVGQALSKKSAWFLFFLAFIAVYREVFETILFYAAMAAQEHVEALVAGALSGAVALAIIAVLMLKFSQRLPIGKFFAYSSALVAVLAVVLAGKGISALQESGLVAVTAAPWAPRIPVLGIFPTVQGITAQAVTLAILLAGFAWNSRGSRRLAAAE